MLETEKYGFYHATNEGGFISWTDFTKEIFAQAGISSKVIPVSTAEYEKIAGKSVASRPKTPASTSRSLKNQALLLFRPGKTLSLDILHRAIDDVF